MPMAFTRPTFLTFTAQTQTHITQGVSCMELSSLGDQFVLNTLDFADMKRNIPRNVLWQKVGLKEKELNFVVSHSKP